MKTQKHAQSPSIETIKLGVEVHADFHVVSVQEDGSSPKRESKVVEAPPRIAAKPQDARPPCRIPVKSYTA